MRKYISGVVCLILGTGSVSCQGASIRIDKDFLPLK